MQDLWRYNRCARCDRIVSPGPKRKKPPKYCIICRQKMQEPYRKDKKK